MWGGRGEEGRARGVGRVMIALRGEVVPGGGG